MPKKTNNTEWDLRERTALGAKLRSKREREGITLRELARRLGLSAGLISHIELGRVIPSVGTLYAISKELDVSIDDLFLPADGDSTSGPAAEPEVSEPGTDAVAGAGRESLPVRGGSGPVLELGSGASWERLTPERDAEVEFLRIDYDVGGASTSEEALLSHAGTEYGHVLSGRLGVTLGETTHELRRGDSISFRSRIPHRLFNAGKSRVSAVWFVVGGERELVHRGHRTAGDG